MARRNLSSEIQHLTSGSPLHGVVPSTTEVSGMWQSNQTFDAWHSRSDPPLHGVVPPDSAGRPSSPRFMGLNA